MRFVSVAPARGDEDGYELVYDDGKPDVAGGVTHITAYLDVADRFLDSWHDVREIVAARRGYLGTRLYRDALGYVAIARWSSPLMVARTAQQPEYRRAVAALGARARSALYTVVVPSAAA
ncbi:MAG TPA: hypothetical protein VFM58_20525 [Solirubrobacteraceae bacterium]|nr:hypothetical protein [Solirubrobacteraceae bacterium]